MNRVNGLLLRLALEAWTLQDRILRVLIQRHWRQAPLLLRNLEHSRAQVRLSRRLILQLANLMSAATAFDSSSGMGGTDDHDTVCSEGSAGYDAQEPGTGCN